MTIKILEQLFINGTDLSYKNFMYNNECHIGGGGSQPSWRDVVISGIGSLTLVNAKENSLNYLKLFGNTEQLPETYIDSVTLEGKCEQRNLPEGYTQYEYLRSTGTQYIDLGYKGNGNTKVEIKFKYYQTSNVTGSGRVFGSRTNSTNNAFAIGSSSGVVASTDNKIFWCYDGQSFYVSDNTFALNEWQTVVFSATEHKINGTAEGDDYTITTFETPSNLMLFAFDNNGTVGVGYVDIAYCKLWDNGVLVRDVVPAGYGTTNSMYDRVSGTMLPNAGTGDFIAGSTATPTPTNPIDIVCNNGTIKASKNLLNNPNYVKGLLGDNGILSTTNGTCTLDYYPVEPNTTYTFSFIKQRDVRYDRVCEYSNNDESSFLNLAVKQNNADTPAIGSTIVMTFTTTANTHYIRIVMACSYLYEDGTPENAQLVQGSTATPYHPYGEIYYDGTVETVTDSNQLTATAQPLLSVGDYKDTQEVLSGAVTRNVGVKPIKGSMVTNYFPSSNRCIISTGNIIATHTPILCTHFPAAALGDYYINHSSDNQFIYCYSKDCSSLEDYQNFFDNLYNAGTPVIVVYPLKTATTETVSGQQLNKEPVTVTGSLTGLVANVVSSSHTVPTPTQPLDIVANNGVMKLSPNLLDIPNMQETRAGITASVNNGLVTLTGTTESGYNLQIVPSSQPVFLTAGTYTISYTGTFEISAGTILLQMRQVGGSTIDTLSNTKSYTTLTLAEDAEIYLNINVGATGRTLNVSINVQIEKGSSATAYIPYGEIYYDGTAEKVEVYSDIAITDSEVIDGQGINSQNGILISNADRCVFTPFFAKAGTKITWSATSDRLGGYLIQYNQPVISAQYWISSIPASAIEHTGNRYSRYAITTTDCYVVCQGTAKWSEMKQNDWKVTKPFESATAQPLLKVGDYQDEHNITSGAVTRNVGIKVLDGSEGWASYQSGACWAASSFLKDKVSGNYRSFSTHYGWISSDPNNMQNNKFLLHGTQRLCIKDDRFTTAAAFRTYLADQYNAGTPVIIVYPLATATTETVTGQPLTIQAGTNIVEITQASIDNLELEVSYKAGVEVTVEEIEAVNNDESVEVTING